MIEITLKLDTEKVEQAIRDVWQREFSPGSQGYYKDAPTGAGWDEITRQVRAHIQTMDLSEEIARAAKAQLAGVVDEVVAAALRDAAKKRAKEMVKNGELLA